MNGDIDISRVVFWVALLWGGPYIVATAGLIVLGVACWIYDRTAYGKRRKGES